LGILSSIYWNSRPTDMWSLLEFFSLVLLVMAQPGPCINSNFQGQPASDFYIPHDISIPPLPMPHTKKKILRIFFQQKTLKRMVHLGFFQVTISPKKGD